MFQIKKMHITKNFPFKKGGDAKVWKFTWADIFILFFWEILFLFEDERTGWWEYLSQHRSFSSLVSGMSYFLSLSELLHFNKMWRIFFSVSSFSLYEIQTLLYFSPRCKEEEKKSRWGVILSASSPAAAAWKYFHQTSEIAIRSTENFPALFFPTAGAKTFVMVIERSDFALVVLSLWFLSQQALMCLYAFCWLKMLIGEKSTPASLGGFAPQAFRGAVDD